MFVINLVVLFGLSAVTLLCNGLDVQSDCGATGNGVTDDTSSIQSCIDTLIESDIYERILYFPSGNYKITSTLTISDDFPSDVYIHGEGWSSIIFWSFDGNLFNFTYIQSSTQIIDRLTIRDLAIYSQDVSKSVDSAAFYINRNISQSLFDHILITGNEYHIPSGIIMKRQVITVTFNDVLLWLITGTGIEIGYGAEVRIIGGRIAGLTDFTHGTGIHVTGNNGGVHIENTDVIGLNYGLIIDKSNGVASNREIFITQATFDSCSTGIAIKDSSYIDIAGIWSASCNYDQVWVSPNASPLLVINGGTIFNGGAHNLNTLKCSNITYNGHCNGITVNGGEFILSNTVVRNNYGIGIWVPNSNVKNYIISGNKIYSNEVGYKYVEPSNNGQKEFVNNLCNGNTDDVVYVDNQGTTTENTCSEEQDDTSTLILNNLVNDLVNKKYKGSVKTRSEYFGVVQDSESAYSGEIRFINSNKILLITCILFGFILALLVGGVIVWCLKLKLKQIIIEYLNSKKYMDEKSPLVGGYTRYSTV